MEQYLDAVLQFLITYVAPQLPSDAGYILGDPTTSAPFSLPFVYVVPLYDAVTDYASLTDMDTYVVPILIIDDLESYGPPIANVNVTSPQAYEQPGYRKLMQWAQIIRNELRAGGQAITMNGIAATSTIPSIMYVWVEIDDKPYRGARIAFQAQERRSRAASP